MIKNKLAVNQILTEGSKYTIHTIDGMNLPVKTQITYKSHVFQKWAQYENSLYITCRIKGRRQDSVLIFPEIQMLVIQAGWTLTEGVRKEIERESATGTMYRVYNKTVAEFLNEGNVLFAKDFRDMFDMNVIEDDRWDYEAIMDLSFDYLYARDKQLEDVKNDNEYKKTLRDYLNKCNWSIDSKMIIYFRTTHPYFLNTIENLV